VTATTGRPPAELARSYLDAARHDDAPGASEAALAALEGSRLAALDDDARTAFWTNVYNAAVAVRLHENPSRLDGLARLRFFRSPVVTVAGHDLSPNDIEHGILRGSALAVGLGYLSRPFPDAFERRHRVREPDPRVHFALHCGAASCPAVAAYDADGVDDQLALATRVYLDETVRYDRRSDTVTVPRLFLWYRGDFGGLAGIWALLGEYDALPPGASAGSRLRYDDYDWSPDLEPFRDTDRTA
jgi:hypothetical protein